MSDRLNAVRLALRRITDPECPGYAPGTSLDEIAEQWV